MGKVSISGAGAAGGGSDECTATRAEVLKGYTAIISASDDEVVEGTLELTGDAADSQVLASKTYYSTDPKNKRKGSMVNHGAMSQTLNTGEICNIPAGYHNGLGKIIANSLVGQTPGTATAAQMLYGYTAWVNGSKLTGNITSLSGQTITPGSFQQTVNCSDKYMTGNINIVGDSNLMAGNILNGIKIFGVTGNVRKYASISGRKTTSGSKNFFLWNYNVTKSYYYLVLPTGFTPLVGVFRLDNSIDPGWNGLALFEGGQYVIPYGSNNGMVNYSGGAQYDNNQMIVPVATSGNYFYTISGYY
ncbi:hypothetical protein ACOAOT_16230 [Lacrimispora sp. AGF001]|uniref:hypothetical protein n=1 Tax=Lacrimispora sp. AGF001 TaxID=3401631 RepID=UPI003B438543